MLGSTSAAANPAPIESGPGPAPAIRQEMGFENWPGGLRGLQSERARAPRHEQSHGTGAANVTEITAFRFAGLADRPSDSTGGDERPSQAPTAAFRSHPSRPHWKRILSFAAGRCGEHDVMPVIAHCAPWDAAFRRIEIAVRQRHEQGRHANCPGECGNHREAHRALCSLSAVPQSPRRLAQEENASHLGGEMKPRN